MDDVDFSVVYRRHARDVYRFALFLSGDLHVAEEVTAETFARAWAGHGRIRLGTVKGYLIAIARNLCRDAGRQRRNLRLPDGYDPTDGAADQERTTRSRQELEAVLSALQQLPEQDRAMLLMATIDGLTHQTIAETLGLSVAAVKVRIYRARVRLNAARGIQEER